MPRFWQAGQRSKPLQLRIEALDVELGSIYNLCLVSGFGGLVLGAGGLVDLFGGAGVDRGDAQPDDQVGPS